MAFDPLDNCVQVDFRFHHDFYGKRLQAESSSWSLVSCFPIFFSLANHVTSFAWGHERPNTLELIKPSSA